MGKFVDIEEGEYDAAVERVEEYVREQYGRDLTSFHNQRDLASFLKKKGEDAAAKLFEGRKGRAWEKVEARKFEKQHEQIEKETGRGRWMDVKKEVMETGKPIPLRENDRYVVRVIKRGRYTSTVVDDKQTGRRMKVGSKRERDVLLGML
jgi:hypothetical protein